MVRKSDNDLKREQEAQIYRALDSGSLLDEIESNPEAWDWLAGEGSALSALSTPSPELVAAAAHASGVIRRQGKHVPFSLAYNPKTGTGTGNVGMTALRGVPTNLSMIPGDADDAALAKKAEALWAARGKPTIGRAGTSIAPITGPITAEKLIRSGVKGLESLEGRTISDADYRDAMAKRETALGAQKTALQHGIEEFQGLQDQLMQETAEFTLEREHMKAAFRLGMQDHQDRLKEVESALLHHKIDPNRAFKSTSSKVMSIIGIALGAFAQAHSGGKLPNTALQIINTAINRDIDAQKTELSTLGRVADLRRNALSMFMQLGRDERTALHQTELAARSYINSQLGIARDKYKNKVDIAGLDETIQANNAEMAKVSMELKKFAFANQMQISGAKLQTGLGMMKANQIAAGRSKKAGDIDPAAVRKVLDKLRDNHLALSVYDGMTVTRDPKTGRIKVTELLASKAKRMAYGVAKKTPLTEWAAKESGLYAEELSHDSTSRVIAGSMIVKMFQGGRPSDKDMVMLLGTIPTADLAPDKAIIDWENLGELMVLVETGQWTPGAGNPYEAELSDMAALDKALDAAGLSKEEKNMAYKRARGAAPGPQGPSYKDILVKD